MVIEKLHFYSSIHILESCQLITDVDIFGKKIKEKHSWNLRAADYIKLG